MTYYDKYLKYKKKYLELQQNKLIKQSGGGNDDKKTIILFKAEWCGHCKKFKDTWLNLKTKYNDKYDFITYDANINSKEISKFNITGYPTLLIQNNKNIVEYNGSRDEDSIVTFIDNFN